MFATGTSVYNVLFRKMLPNVPIVRRSAESFRIYSGSKPSLNFEIGSSVTGGWKLYSFRAPRSSASARTKRARPTSSASRPRSSPPMLAHRAAARATSAVFLARRGTSWRRPAAAAEARPRRLIIVSYCPEISCAGWEPRVLPHGLGEAAQGLAPAAAQAKSDAAQATHTTLQWSLG